MAPRIGRKREVRSEPERRINDGPAIMLMHNFDCLNECFVAGRLTFAFRRYICMPVWINATEGIVQYVAVKVQRLGIISKRSCTMLST